MPDTFEQNRPSITHFIERLTPLEPVDRAGAGREVSVLAAVIVVDVGGSQPRSRGTGFRGGAECEVGVARIERQRK
jgi:hypothetical protein